MAHRPFPLWLPCSGTREVLRCAGLQRAGPPAHRPLHSGPSRAWQPRMLQAHLGSTSGSHLDNWLPKQGPSRKRWVPQSFVASHLLRHLLAQKGPQFKRGKSPSGTKSCLAGTSPAELLLFFFSREIKAIVSTLGPNPSDLKWIAYATWWLQRGTARSDPSVCTGVSLNRENPSGVLRFY